MAAGEVTLTPYFEISGVVTAVDVQGRLHFDDASYRHQTSDFKEWRNPLPHACLVTTPPESIALIFEGREVICRTEATLGEITQARCGLSGLPPDSMLSSLLDRGRLSQSEWLVQLGLMRPNCIRQELFLVALPDDALTSDAAKTWQAGHHREPDIWPPAP